MFANSTSNRLSSIGFVAGDVDLNFVGFGTRHLIDGQRTQPKSTDDLFSVGNGGFGIGDGFDDRFVVAEGLLSQVFVQLVRHRVQQ